jgi:hypothetical protein
MLPQPVRDVRQLSVTSRSGSGLVSKSVKESDMFLGAYHFDGDPGGLIAAYERLMKALPPEAIDLHVCVERADGLTVYDACPSREIFASFSTGPDLRAAIEAAGLPAPRIEELGVVRAARLRAGLEP